MITYKPSARIPELKEENFTSDPTSRGWTITGTGASINGGLRCSGNNTPKTAIAKYEGDLTKYLSFTFTGDSVTGNSTNVQITIKLDDVTLFSRSGNISYTGNTGIFGNCTIYKNKKGSWIATLSRGFNTVRYSEVITQYITNDLDRGKLCIELSFYVSNVNNGYVTLTNLKWV